MFCRFLSRLLFLAGPPTVGLADTTKHIIEIWGWGGTRPGRNMIQLLLNTPRTAAIMKINLIYTRRSALMFPPINISAECNSKFSPQDTGESVEPLTMCEIWERGGNVSVSKRSRKDKIKCWELRLFLTPRLAPRSLAMLTFGWKLIPLSPLLRWEEIWNIKAYLADSPAPA